MAIALLDKHHFLLRRLHSLTGIVPIGVFLLNHLLTNSSILWGGFALRGEQIEGLEPEQVHGGVAYFQKEVAWINEQIPHLLLIELSLWGAIAFHSILGVYYATTGKSNTTRYAYQDNWRYTLQRLTGYLGILFIFYHVATLRWGWTWLVPGGVEWSHHHSSSTLAQALRGDAESITFLGVLVALLYFAGITAMVFHFANGLWTAAITWGLTITVQAQKRWGVVCAGLGAGLMLAAWGSLAGFFFLKPAEARLVEDAMGGHATPAPHATAENAPLPLSTPPSSEPSASSGGDAPSNPPAE
ncbi:MAG: hypothetical protein R3B68_04680 [Phycisphaerales bacterium]